MLKCKHQCHCACNSEILTCIDNGAGRQAAHKKTNKQQRKYAFFGRTTFYTHVCRYILTFKAKKKTFKKITKLTGSIDPFK